MLLTLYFINIDILNNKKCRWTIPSFMFLCCLFTDSRLLLARTLYVLQSLPSRKHPHKLRLIDKMNCSVNRKFINGTTKSFVDGGKLHLSAERRKNFWNVLCSITLRRSWYEMSALIHSGWLKYALLFSEVENCALESDRVGMFRFYHVKRWTQQRSVIH